MPGQAEVGARPPRPAAEARAHRILPIAQDSEQDMLADGEPPGNRFHVHPLAWAL